MEDFILTYDFLKGKEGANEKTGWSEGVRFVYTPTLLPNFYRKYLPGR